MGKVSEEQNARRFELCRQGLSDKQVGERCGVGEKAICQWRKVHNVPTNGRRPRPKRDVAPYDQMKRELRDACDFRKLRQEGVPIWRSVAEYYGVDPTAAFYHIQQLLWDEEDYA